MKHIFTIGIVIFFQLNSIAQKCGTVKHYLSRAEKDPSVLLRMQQAEQQTQEYIQSHSTASRLRQITTIPVVVHVLWHDATENISDAQIQSQIDILNRDYRLQNADSLKTNHPFWPNTADAQIEFCLATRDPQGHATTGITRTYTDSSAFSGMGYEKYNVYGGKNNWSPSKYLNIWVCNLGNSGGTLGYSAFPSDLSNYPSDDGVVIHFEAFGDTGTAGAGMYINANLGRTATHEVGHWLNLRHIWGDDLCGDDLVSDTEPAEDANYGCPSFPYNSFNTCGSGVNGEMYMNFMDYVDDSCMKMFTSGQTVRMQAVFNSMRAGIVSSLGCGTPIPYTSIETVEDLNSVIEVFPNPNKGVCNISTNGIISDKANIVVCDILGLSLRKIENITSFPYTLNVEDLPNGTYYLSINLGGKSVTKKIAVVH